MTNLEKAKEIIKEHIQSAQCGIYDTRNIVGDPMTNIYNADGLVVDICRYWSYFEVFGLTKVEFNELENYYDELVNKFYDHTT